MAKVKDLAVVTGTYEKDGHTKKRYMTIGALMSTSDGGQYILLDPLVNLAAVPRQEGRDRVIVSLFDPKESTEHPSGGRPAKSKEIYGDAEYKAAMTAQKPLDDDIPF